MKFHWLSHLLLIHPARIERRLEEIRRAAFAPDVPNTWQVTLGALRMWHRVLYRPETIGTCTEDAVRKTWRARLLQYRGFRLPFLLRERAIAPWDMSGMLSSPERVRRHLVAAHHDTGQFAYDLELLQVTPPELEQLHREVAALVDRPSRRSDWLRDLVVYENYHERLYRAVQATLQGEPLLSREASQNPDMSFIAYLSWCAQQPSTPRSTYRAWLEGSFDLERGLIDRASPAAS